VLRCKRSVETPANVRPASGIDDELAQGTVCDVTFQVGSNGASLGAVSAVLLPKTP
jgi:hypothetical protein